jgi:simple sugar transport system permease protein
MVEAFEILFTASFWVAAIRIASPLIFATMGELICERAGVLNLGIEGIMAVGAFAGWMTVYSGGDLWTGVAVAALARSPCRSACRSMSSASASRCSPPA